MSPIQIILLSILLIFGFLVYIKGFVRWLKVSAIIFVTVGAYFVILPEKANALASVMQVGRGADLMLYFFVMIFTFSGIAMYQKIKKLELVITRLLRENAKKEGFKIGKKSSYKHE